MTEEKRLERKLRKIVEGKKYNGWCIKIPGVVQKGLPDRVCLFPGAKIVFVEVKGPGLDPSPMQRWVIRRLKKLGFPVYVLDRDEVLAKILTHAE